ncbi:hypothetical protein OSB04_001845 [Centaurea solstitialis]|uniref:Uncharacterized protein n=1 Tax=Centaurea solstitialis TaxID=347529 RepID=A0AA38WUM3_9ASTR|nr:hypothetical protein OSB04_001845 [Centaurea solstitialis]
MSFMSAQSILRLTATLFVNMLCAKQFNLNLSPQMINQLISSPKLTFQDVFGSLFPNSIWVILPLIKGYMEIKIKKEGPKKNPTQNKQATFCFITISKSIKIIQNKLRDQIVI